MKNAGKNATENLTKRMLAVNVAIVITYATIALVTGILVSSQTILAEGLSNLGAVPVAVLNLFVIKFIAKANPQKYPFGKETLEPFIGVPNNIFLLTICIMVIISSVQMLLTGGNEEIQVTSSILFGVFSVVFNTCVYRYFSSLAKKNPSPLVMATVIAWKFSVLVGAGIVLGFSISWALNLTPLSGITPFIDPVLAIILMLVFASSPIAGVRDCMRELMQTAPPADIACAVTRKIEEISGGYEFDRKVLRMGKVGDKVIVEIDYVVNNGSALETLAEQDTMRNRLAEAFAELPYKIWLNVAFTGHERWTEHVLA